MNNPPKLSEILNSELKVLLLVFFNINYSQDDNNIAILANFKKSKYTSYPYEKETLYSEIAEKMTSYYNIPFSNSKAGISCNIENDLSLSFDQIITKLRTMILINISKEQNLVSIDKSIALSIFLLRGSIDIKMNFMSVDVMKRNETDIYLESLFRIISSSNQLLKYLNWNFRELQNDFISGKRRNTQLRINLRWIYENLLDEFSELNIYKHSILVSNEVSIGNLPKSERMYTTFINRLKFYREKVAGQELKNIDIKELRNELFDEKSDIPRRSRQIVLTIKNLTDDICSACNSDYPISHRSFIVPKDNRYYFEYHHVISFSNDKENLDVPDNLVKLCPTCHRAMTPGRAEDTYQKCLIKNILENRSDVLDFSSAYFNSTDLEHTICRIHEHLK